MWGFLLDLPNLMFLHLVLFIIYRLKLLPNWVVVVLALESFTPIFLNDFLFPAKYMPDQFRYYDVAHSIRHLDFEHSIDPTKTVTVAAWMLSFIPMPFIETIKSLGYFNRLLFIILLTWLYNKKHLRGLPINFLLFFPSLLLYTSLSLRETLIMSFMLVSSILYLERRYLMSFMFGIPLLYIKPQNFYLMIVFYLFFLLSFKDLPLYRYRYIIASAIVPIVAPLLNTVVEKLNFYRRAMYAEDGGNLDRYIPIETVADLFTMSLTSAPYFLLKPFLWEASNILQLIQSVENMMLFAFIIYITTIAVKQDFHIASRWFLFLFAALSLYGLVVSNYGSAVRYKFPIIVVYVIGMAYDLYMEKKYVYRGFAFVRKNK